MLNRSGVQNSNSHAVKIGNCSEDQELHEMADLKKLENDIAKVEIAIQKTEGKIQKAEGTELEHLWEKDKQLRTKEQQLRTKEEQLREKENLFLRLKLETTRRTVRARHTPLRPTPSEQINGQTKENKRKGQKRKKNFSTIFSLGSKRSWYLFK